MYACLSKALYIEEAIEMTTVSLALTARNLRNNFAMFYLQSENTEQGSEGSDPLPSKPFLVPESLYEKCHKLRRHHTRILR